MEDFPEESACTCKVGRNSEKYRCPDLDRRLVRQHVDGASLRKLEETVNKAFLTGAVEAASVDLIGEVDSVYRLLTDDTVSAGRREEVRHRLSQSGVDVERLEADFVTYQTVRTHLQSCLGLDTSRDDQVDLDGGRRTIEWARARSESVVERTLDRLSVSNELELGEYEVTQIFRVTCTDCGTTAIIDDILQSGGCACGGR